MTNLTKRQSCIAIFAGILVLYTAGATRAQTPTPRPTGEFLCSAGTRDGVACNSDDDCPGGVCVIAQGVCDGGDDDGFPCDCAAGSCNAQPVCSDDATLGTCGSGVSAGECCDVTTNCAGGVTCRGTQKVCLAGDSKGFSCVNDQQCPSSVCRSTGKFCDGGDFDGFSCVDNSDCPNSTGGCVAVVVVPTATATRTSGTTTATRTRTPTATSRTAVPTTSTPTATRIGTTVIPSATPTRTATVPTVVVRPTSTRPPGGTRHIFISEGGGCALMPPSGDSSLALLIGAGLTVRWMRKRRPR